ncbi:hypothetical protein B0A50_06816 [Salinomyces thailandicus]|uniref:Inositol-pentakisphosphate 2-kinase n=1 Tax=Salinomyces thailandicus TaxID=706561 RepID=A0A4U0TR03_9PEZI|nr:hypothetical protein B0A50_06816 [Salinomyces thailandica]
MDLSNYTPTPQSAFPPRLWFAQKHESLAAQVSIQRPVDRPAAPCVTLYLNEGGANFVFKFSPQDCQDPSMQLQGPVPLLRIRKNLSHVQGAEQQLQAFNEHFRPLFPPQHLIEHELVELDEGAVPALNASLKRYKRPSNRSGDVMAEDEKYGLLVTDMSPLPREARLVQLKPKWLAQSPTAPRDAKRCRTCALRAQRAARGVRTATDAQESCPLALVSENVEDRRQAAAAATQDKTLQVYIVRDALPLFKTLREKQQEFDARGVLDDVDDAATADVCKAMTLRDCTLFLHSGPLGIEARLGDLDMKQPEKLDKWRSVERSLIDEGWYGNAEPGDAWTEEKVCLLSRR